MTQNLFVYGTLMSADSGALGRAQRERLQSEARCLGSATIGGRLYDIGRYPGLIESADPADIVHGEVFALEDAPATFRWLDPYESIVPGDHVLSEYARSERAVRLTSGVDVIAWVYIYNQDISAARLVASGMWLKRS